MRINASRRKGGQIGRGRQKAKQTKIARKLKYLTTDTDYDELAKELSHQDGESPSAADPFAKAGTSKEEKKDSYSEANYSSSEEMDEYAQWAAEAAKKAESESESKAKAARKPVRMPVPSALIHKAAVKKTVETSKDSKTKKAAGKGKNSDSES